MGKYSKYQRKSPPRKPVSPLWRGFGCILMLIVPAISYFISKAFLGFFKAKNLVPPELLGYFHFPEWLIGLRFLATPVSFLANLKDFWAMVIFYFVTFFIITGLISFIYSALGQLLGPARYGELDAPPAKRKTKEYKR